MSLLGKTAPRLLQDLSLYDPRKQPSAGFNILSQIPFHDEEKEPLQLPNGKGSCKHQWSMKGNQCSLPENGYKADVDLLWKIAAYCAACRSHLDLSLEFEDRLDDCMPCPTQDRPLHHFVHLPDLSKSRHPGTSLPKQDDDFAWMDTQVFQCSHFECASKLVIRFKPPRLIPDWVSQLTDQETIKNRAEKAIISDLARFEGHSVPRPMEVLINTETYINNAMYMERRRQIRRENKKWMLNLGDSCASMLEYMGFTNDVRRRCQSPSKQS
jgi:ubiquitin carboxyl-terminal hydrolase 25/28